MTAEEAEQAAAYLKLQENVSDLIVKTVTHELITNPSGALAMQLSYITRHNMQDELKLYRVTKIGCSA